RRTETAGARPARPPAARARAPDRASRCPERRSRAATVQPRGRETATRNSVRSRLRSCLFFGPCRGAGARRAAAVKRHTPSRALQKAFSNQIIVEPLDSLRGGCLMLWGQSLFCTECLRINPSL